ncbi:MAG: T9SS type A sorting domain-containing protein [Bacteroidota bacterium]
MKKQLFLTVLCLLSSLLWMQFQRAPQNTVTAATSSAISSLNTITVPAPHHSTSHQREALILFPIPAFNQLNIESREPMQEVTIYNTLGQQLSNFKLDAEELSLKTHLLDKGIYLLEVSYAENRVAQKKFLNIK